MYQLDQWTKKRSRISKKKKKKETWIKDVELIRKTELQQGSPIQGLVNLIHIHRELQQTSEGHCLGHILLIKM